MKEAGSALFGISGPNLLCVRLFAWHHLQFYDINDCLFLTPWAIERKVNQYRIFENLYPCFVIADRAANPKRFFFHHPPFLFTIYSYLTEDNAASALAIHSLLSPSSMALSASIVEVTCASFMVPALISFTVPATAFTASI